jgi:precorrin-6Y C5,15-methyltransferase (decarboxylating)
MTAWLTIVGIGEDGFEALAPAARAAIEAAECLVGGARHLAMVPQGGARRVPWSSPITDTIAEIRACRPRPVCVIATGDPMWCGVGATLARHVPADEMRVIAQPSALALAAARLGWAEAEIAVVSVHGRPVAPIERHIHPGQRVLVVSEDGSTPGEVARRLRARGFGRSALTVLEHLGGPRERVRQTTAEDYDLDDVRPLNMVAVACVAGAGADIRPCVPGLADDAFVSDGQLSKRETRAVTLARLMPMPDALLWDVGAGSGAVAIEWMRAAPRARAIAIEPKSERRALIRQNAEALGVPDIEIVAGRAPDALAGLAAPDAVFIGGGIGRDGGAASAELAHAALGGGGRLVANAVTVAGEAALTALQARFGGELTRIAVARAEPLGASLGWRALMPVTQWALVKPRSAA